MSCKTKALLMRILGLVVCVVPPALATIEYFPLFKEDGGKQVSAIGVVVLALCAIPFWKHLRSFLKSPSAWKLWLVVLVVSAVCRSVVDELFVISAIGLPSGVVGALIFWCEHIYRRKKGLYTGGVKHE